MGRRLGGGTAGSGGRFDWRIAAIGGFVLLGLVVVVAMVVLGSGRDQYAGTIYPDQGGGHVPACAVGEYSSSPPTSGCHDPSPANWGVNSIGASVQNLIHNLEHGGIVIWYQPGQVSDDQLAELTSYANAQVSGPRFKVILSPWDGTDFGHPIAIAAWRYLLYQDMVNLDAIRGFTAAHYQRSPEPNGGPNRPAA